MKHISPRSLLVLLLVLGVVAACGPAGAKRPSTARPTPRAKVTRKVSPTGLLPTASSSGPLRLNISVGPPQPAINATLEALNGAGLSSVEQPDDPDLQLTDSASRGGQLVFERIFVPVDRFSTLLDSISLDELAAVWTGNGTSRKFSSIYPSQDIMDDLEALLGPAGKAVKPQSSGDMADSVWNDPMGIGIVAFEALTPRLRALRIDGQSALDNRLDPGKWALATHLWLVPVTTRGGDALTTLTSFQPVTNRDLGKLTVLVMTGVTAMTRHTAEATENAHDDAYVARVVGFELAAADITTTSNEVSFLDNCKPDIGEDVMTFCSKTGYMASLDLAGIDLVGLTGNHLNDYGTQAFLNTLDLYKQKGIKYYGGGANEAEARAPLIITHHGNRLAFIGANQYGPESYESHAGDRVTAWAGPDSPGAARFSRSQMVSDIQALRSQADVVFAEVQHTEFDDNGNYQIRPLPEQVADFRAISAAGADVVTGIHSHTPQAVEFRGDGLILYGLGNIFFDQVYSWAVKTGLTARHTIYAGRLLNTELLVTEIDPDRQPRWATPEERVTALTTVFKASGW